MLNIKRRRPGAEQVCLPVGDGSSKLGAPMHTDWIVCISHILQILEDNQKTTVDIDMLRRFGSRAAFESRVSKENADLSSPLSKTFKRLIRHLFRNRTVDVQAAPHRSKTDCCWASMFFVLGNRSVGLHFLNVEPYCDVFQEPKGETLDPAVLKEAEEAEEKELKQFRLSQKKNGKGTPLLPNPERRPSRGVPPSTTEPSSSGWTSRFGAPPVEGAGWTPPAISAPALPPPAPVNSALPPSLLQTLNAMRARSGPPPVQPTPVYEDPMLI